WEDLETVAELLTAPSESRWGLAQAFATSFADPQIIAARIMEMQGSMFTADGSPQWSTPPGVEALEFQTSFIADAQVTSQDSVRLTAEDLCELVPTGQAAMIHGASSRAAQTEEQDRAENGGGLADPAEDGARLAAEALYELLSTGQAAMINGASSRVAQMQEQVGAENVGFLHYPSQKGDPPSPGNLAGWSVGVWAGSKKTEQAADFVAHL